MAASDPWPCSGPAWRPAGRIGRRPDLICPDGRCGSRRAHRSSRDRDREANPRSGTGREDRDVDPVPGRPWRDPRGAAVHRPVADRPSRRPHRPCRRQRARRYRARRSRHSGGAARPAASRAFGRLAADGDAGAGLGDGAGPSADGRADQPSDIEGQEALEAELLAGETSALLVSRDRAFVRAVGNRSWRIDGKRLVAEEGPEAFFRAALGGWSVSGLLCIRIRIFFVRIPILAIST